MEILRQRQIYEALTEEARASGSQIIAASHSEVVLNEAADKDVVVAFVGQPHRIDDRGSQVLKSIRDIGFQHYYQAEQRGWVLYLEGSTDLAILRAFAETLGHDAAAPLDSPFLHTVGNVPNKVSEHFHGLKEAKPDLVAFALFDRLDNQQLYDHPQLTMMTWARREIENYLCQPETLEAFAGSLEPDGSQGLLGGHEPLLTLLATQEAIRRKESMHACIEEFVAPAYLRDRNHPWWSDTKASDGFLDQLFPAYFQRLGLPNLMSKSDYHMLARYVPRELISSEVTEVLDLILEVSLRAKPLIEPSDFA